jgi:hypothetical protein
MPHDHALAPLPAWAVPRVPALPADPSEALRFGLAARWRAVRDERPWPGRR